MWRNDHHRSAVKICEVCIYNTPQYMLDEEEKWDGRKPIDEPLGSASPIRYNGLCCHGHGCVSMRFTSFYSFIDYSQLTLSDPATVLQSPSLHCQVLQPSKLQNGWLEDFYQSESSAYRSSWMFWLFLHAVTHTSSSHVKALPLWISMDAVHKSFFNAMRMPSFLR